MYKVYQVQSGDSLERISRMFQTTPEMLKKINGITNNMTLIPGTFVIVPIEEENLFDVYTVQKGDNMYAIARTNHVDYEMLLELNGLDADDYIYPEQEILIPKKNVKMYRVKDGDTVTSVTSALNTNYEELSKYNQNIFLMPGQILFYK